VPPEEAEGKPFNHKHFAQGKTCMEIGNSKSVAEREDEGITIDIRDASGEVEKGVSITVVGTYSKTYRKVQSENRDKFLKQRRNSLDGDSLEAQSIETTAKCIKGWTGFTSAGENFPYSKENAIALLTNAPWIREQVEEAMNDHSAFFPKPLAA
jgi:hypothetical protein